MSISLYDEAIYNKIHAWVPDNRMRVLKVDETAQLFRMAADIRNDKPLTLPLVSILRKSEINLGRATKSNLTYDGLHLNNEDVTDPDNESKTLQLNAIPVDVSYQIDVYTRDYYEGDEFIRELAFKLMNNPKLVIEIPYNKAKLPEGKAITHTAYIKLVGSIVDNSDIAEKRFADQFTRWTIQFKLDSAYMFNIPERKNYTIDANADLNTGGGGSRTDSKSDGELHILTKLSTEIVDDEIEELKK